MAQKNKPDLDRTWDVLVIGGGNAALCAAMSAKENGAGSVLVLEASPKDVRGGNSRHTRNLRYMHRQGNSFLTGPYPEEEFYNDLLQVTKGNTNEELARFTVQQSNNIGDWMMAHGCMFQPAMKGTLSLARTNGFFLGGGKALMNGYYRTAAKLGVAVSYETEVVDLEIEDGVFKSATVVHKGEKKKVVAKTVVLACGGFQANLDWLEEAWGPEARNFLVRGTPFDKGTVLRLMQKKGAVTIGDPTQGHMVAIDGRSPKYDGGIVTRLDCVSFGIVLNKNCERFYDEGEEIWPKRYAIWGRLVGQQPEQVAYCIIDAKSIDLFMPSVFPPVEAGTIEELAEKLDLDPAKVKETVITFNRAAGGDLSQFKPGDISDPLSTQGLEPPKSHWARPIDKAPFYAYPLRPGITFTYLSLKINTRAQVIMAGEKPAENIFAAGELVSGNVLGQGYMAGFGMTIGTVFGCVAGKEAANV